MNFDSIKKILDLVEKGNPTNIYINNKGLSQLGSIIFYPKEHQKKDQIAIKQLIEESFPKNYKEVLNKLEKYHFSSYYTSEDIIEFQVQLLKTNSIKPKKILEPSAGNGAYVQILKKAFPDAEIIALEPDILSYSILNSNNQFNDKVTCINTTFEDYFLKHKSKPDFDLVISNIPFGNFNINKPLNHLLLTDQLKNVNLFFNHYSQDLLKPGGHAFILTSKNFLDKSTYEPVRRSIASNNDLINIFRFNNNLFKEEKTKVVSDLILYQHNPSKHNLKPLDELFIKTDSVVVEDHNFTINSFLNKNKNNINGDFAKGVFHNRPDLTIVPNEEKLASFLDKMQEQTTVPEYKVIPIRTELNKGPRKEKTRQKVAEVKEATLIEPQAFKLTKKTSKPITINDVDYLKGNTKLFNGSFNKDKTGKVYFSLTPETIAPVHKNYAAIVDSYIQLRNEIVIYYDNCLNNRFSKEELLSKFNDIDYAIDTFHFQVGFLRDNKTILARDFYYDKITDLAETSVLLKNGKTTAEKNKNFTSDYFLNLNSNNNLSTKRETKTDLKASSEEQEKKATKNVSNDNFKLTNTVDYEKAKDLKELVHLYYDENASINLEFIAEVSKKTKAEILEEGLNQKIFYLNPDFKTGELSPELYFVFSSGNIDKKIDFFQNYKDLPEYINLDTTVKHLESIKNAKLDISQIEFNFESFFVPTEAKKAFFKFLINEDLKIITTQFNSSITLHFNQKINFEADDRFSIKLENQTLYSYKKLLQNFADNKYPVVTYKTEDKDGNSISKIHTNGTSMAKTKYEQLQLEFKSFIINDEKYKTIVEDSYYDTFLADKNMITSPNVLKFPKTLEHPPYDHQKAATLYGLMRGTALFDHKVGHGKSLSMGMLSDKLIKHKKADKILLLTLKSVSQQLYKEINLNFPHLNIVLLNQKNFSAQKRDKTLNILKNDDSIDLIIGEHTFLKQIPKEKEALEFIYRKKIDMIEQDLETAKEFGLEESKRIRKGLVKRKETLEEKLDIALKKQESNTVITTNLKEIGIDCLMIDEAHKFKNIGYTTRHNNVSGLNNPQDNITNLDLEITIKSIHSRAGEDKNIFFYSGTPIKNSVTELYAYQRYLTPTELENKNISNFDAWASVFLKQSIQAESDIFGNPRMHTRFRYFTNMPEISKMYRSFSHISNDSTFKTHNIDLNQEFKVIEPTLNYDNLRQASIEFSQNKRQNELFGFEKYDEKELKSSYITALNINRNCLVDPLIEKNNIAIDFDEEDQIKINALCKDAVDRYTETKEHKGVCLIFSDLGVWNAKKNYNTYDTIKNILISKYSIPEEEIDFAQKAKTENRMDEFQNNIRNGKVRFAIGSTQTLGTGTNIQNRVVGIYDLDIPWSPDAFEQRLGRGLRAGNVTAQHYGNKVVNKTYGVKDTTDIFSYSLNKHKSVFIEQIKSINQDQRIYDDFLGNQGADLSHAQREAALIGDMETFKLVKLEEDLKGIATEKLMYDIGVANAAKKIENLSDINKNLISDLVGLQKLKNDNSGLIPITSDDEKLKKIQEKTYFSYKKIWNITGESKWKMLDYYSDNNISGEGFEAINKLIAKASDNFNSNLVLNTANIMDLGNNNTFIFQREKLNNNKFIYRFGIKKFDGVTVYGRSQYKFAPDKLAFNLFKVIKKIDEKISSKNFDVNHNLKSIDSNKKILSTSFPKDKLKTITSLNKEIKKIKKSKGI